VATEGDAAVALAMEAVALVMEIARIVLASERLFFEPGRPSPTVSPPVGFLPPPSWRVALGTV